MCLAELGLSHFDAAIGECNIAIDAGYHVYPAYTWLAASHALKGNIEEAKAAIAEARRLNPKLTVKSMRERYPDFPPWIFEGLRKAGPPEE